MCSQYGVLHCTSCWWDAGTTGSGTFAMTLLLKYGDNNVPNVKLTTFTILWHFYTLNPGQLLMSNFGVEYSAE